METRTLSGDTQFFEIIRYITISTLTPIHFKTKNNFRSQYKYRRGIGGVSMQAGAGSRKVEVAI